MANPFTPPPSRTLSFFQEVLYADPNWNQGYTRPIIYEFSNGRTFQAPVPLYGTSTSTGTGTGTGTSTSTVHVMGLNQGGVLELNSGGTLEFND